MKSINRCHWVNLKNLSYIDYHDNEWGKPVHQDQKHFENLILEGAQAGLSWETILNKRDNYRIFFHNFDPKKIAKLTDQQLEVILQSPLIVRHRLKIYSVRKNAVAFLQIQKEFKSFNNFIWSFTDNQTISYSPKKTNSICLQISKTLKKYGFSFVGETIIESYLMASGIIQAHDKKCYLFNRKPIK